MINKSIFALHSMLCLYIFCSVWSLTILNLSNKLAWYKNDSRQLFNHTFLYSFHRIYKATEFEDKGSVVMTTRRDAGSVIEKINTLSMRCGKE